MFALIIEPSCHFSKLYTQNSKQSLFVTQAIQWLSNVQNFAYCIHIFKEALHLQKHWFKISGGPLSALTCCVNVRLLSGDKKNIAVNLFSKLGWELGLYYASYDDFHPDILARMYT